MQYNITSGSIISTAKVVTLDLAKLNSKITWSDEDSLLNLILDASIEDVENYIDGPIRQKNINIGLSGWVTKFELPVYPVTSITAISYKNTEGQTVNVPATDYLFYSVEAANKIHFVIDEFPDLDMSADFPITINCVGGYPDDEMPAAIKNAVLLRFSHRHMFREDVPTSLNRTFYSALRPYRRY